MSNGDQRDPVQYGWVCPACGKANAPWMEQCPCVGKAQESPFKPDPTQWYVPYWAPSQTAVQYPRDGYWVTCENGGRFTG